MSLIRGYMESPLGYVQIVSTTTHIKQLQVLDSIPAEYSQTNPQPLVMKTAFKQLAEYFDKQREVFDLPLAPDGTVFQQQVWNTLLTIPFGKTASYLDLARKLGDEKTVRAVGAANGKNPLWIVIPCHRIVGSNGALTGYAGGLWRKKWLLDHEQALAQLQLSL